MLLGTVLLQGRPQLRRCEGLRQGRGVGRQVDRLRLLPRRAKGAPPGKPSTMLLTKRRWAAIVDKLGGQWTSDKASAMLVAGRQVIAQNVAES